MYKFFNNGTQQLNNISNQKMRLSTWEWDRSVQGDRIVSLLFFDFFMIFISFAAKQNLLFIYSASSVSHAQRHSRWRSSKPWRFLSSQVQPFLFLYFYPRYSFGVFFIFYFLYLFFFNWKEAKSEIADKESERLSSYQYVGRTGSVIPTASLAGTEVSVEEIRSAAAFSDYYPPSLHAALISSPEPDPDGNLIFYSQFAICSFILLNLS